MGYKLAGFDHLGGVEIDQQVAEIYQSNHHPQYLFIQDIREFNSRNDLPEILYNLDLLDGSPPCSSFSIGGNREKDWGKKKSFREGSKEQRLDDLVFHYISTIKKLQPKVALLENVKGLVIGNARIFAANMMEQFKAAGYRVQLFKLNSATMGVPQNRERVFFIGLRKDFKLPKLILQFRQPVIPFKTVMSLTNHEDQVLSVSDLYLKYWNETEVGESVGKFRACTKLNPMKPPPTIGAQGGYNHFHPFQPRPMSKQEVCMCGTFPLDFDFKGLPWHYLIGMSVPPVMTAQIAFQIQQQWLFKINALNMGQKT